MTDNERTERERVARAICDTSGDDWHREGPEGLMDAYGPLADAAIAALRPADSGLVERLEACANDPMWADHAEVSKALLRRAATALRAQGQEERAEIVAFVRANFDAPHVAEVAKRIADAIEAGQHKEAGRG